MRRKEENKAPADRLRSILREEVFMIQPFSFALALQLKGEKDEEYFRWILPAMEEAQLDWEQNDPAVLFAREKQKELLRALLYLPMFSRQAEQIFKRARARGLELENRSFLCVTTDLEWQSVREKDKGPQLFLEKLGTRFLGQGFTVYGFNGGERALFLLSFPGGRGEEAALRQARTLCCRLRELLLRRFGLSVAFFLSTLCTEPQQLSAAYQQTCAAYMMRLASPGSPPVLCWEELGSGEGQPLPAAAYHQLEEGLYQHLKECFAQRRFSAAQQLAQRIVRLDMANTPDINIQRLRAGRLICFILDQLEELPEVQLPEQDRGELLLIDTLTGVEAKCLPILDSLAIRYGENRQKMLCSQVMQYIDQWYADPSLSPVTLAERFGLSSGYLAALLRRFHFASPAAAIEKRRVEAAAELLCSTKLSIRQIAQRTGYAYAPETFTRAFKRLAGKTPKGYREAHDRKQGRFME